ncbi:MAG: Maf family protein [Mariprofundaceae bacterium]|nr:Maf family protein [Mariprofundaceae bacterium]
MTTDTQLILASTSPYRKELLTRLRLPFTICAPDFDEAAPDSMPPVELVRHNTLGKARAVSALHPDASVIAADQLAVCGDMILGKPGNHDAACTQLAALSGKTVDFFTGVALHCGNKRPDEAHYAMVPFRVCFRNLSDADIETYLRAERPYDCAGSFKGEALGIVLFERMCGDDPTALTGLPLITLAGWLKPLQTAV